MKKILMLFLLIFLSVSVYSFDSEAKLIIRQLDNYKKDKFALNENFLITGGVVTILAFSIDGQIRELAQNYPNDSGSTKIKDFFNSIGGGYSVVIPASGYLAGLVLKDEKLKNASFVSLESLTAAVIIMQVSKTVIGRSRPDNGRGSFDFKPFSFGDEWNSFPSGHSTAAWAFVTPYAVYYDNPWVLLIPAGVSAARVVSDRHWTSDVIAGGILGYFVGYNFAKLGMENVEFTGNGIKMSF